MVFTPKEIVEYTINELCLIGSNGASIEELWTIVVQKQPDLDEFFKSICWTWLIQDPDFEVYLKKNELLLVRQSYKDIKHTEGLIVKASENREWLFLTGMPKFENPVTPLLFDLLLAIAQSREHGIRSTDLAKKTGQDLKSFTSRFKFLKDYNLIERISLREGKAMTNFIFHSKFYDKNKLRAHDTVYLKEKRLSTMSNIVSLVKQAPNQIRGVSDIAKQLGLSGPKGRAKMYRYIDLIVEQGSLKQVYLSGFGNQLLKAVEYVKDLEVFNVPESDIEDVPDNDEGEEPDDEGEIGVIEEEPMIGMSAQLTKDNVEELMPNFTPVFSIFNCMGAAIHNSGINGLSSMDLDKMAVGEDAGRIMGRLSAYIVKTEKQLSKGFKNGDLECVRVIDFSGKMKFNKFYTASNLMKMKKLDPIPYGDEFSSLPEYLLKGKTLTQISCANFKDPSSALDIVTCKDGVRRLHWQGYPGTFLLGNKLPKEKRDYSLITDNTATPVIEVPSLTKKGRPKKGAPKVSKTPPLSRSEAAETETEPEPESEQFADQTTRTSNFNINFDLLNKNRPFSEKILGLFENPFTLAYRRRQGILDLLRENDGAALLDVNFVHQLDKRISNTKASSDRRTIIRDFEYLTKEGEAILEDFEMECNNGRRKRKLLMLDLKCKPTAQAIEKAKLQAERVSYSMPSGDLSVTEKDITFHFPFVRNKVAKAKPELSSSSELNALRSHEKDNSTRVKILNEPPLRVSRSKKRAESDNGNQIEKFVKKTKRRKKLSETENKAKHELQARRTRRLINLDKNIGLVLLRAVIISKSLSQNGLFPLWDEIAKLFDEKASTQVLKRSWDRLRKLVGSKTIQRMTNIWKKILISAIRDRRVTKDTILNHDLRRFVELWRESDGVSFGHITSLYEDIEENYNEFEFVKDPETEDPLFFFKSSVSFVERENFVKGLSFGVPIDVDGDRTKNKQVNDESSTIEKLKSTLKAIFATPKEDFSSTIANNITSKYSESMIHEALTSLEKDRQIVFLGTDAPVKFALSEKVITSMTSKLPYSFFQDSVEFVNVLSNLFKSQHGMLLSPITPDYTIPVILSFMIKNIIHVVRVDNSIDNLFTGYTSRTIDRKKLESDFIITSGSRSLETMKPRHVPVPVGVPCSMLWIGVNGNINTKIWTNLVCSVVSNVEKRPGVILDIIHEPLRPCITKRELKLILDWLVAKGIFREGLDNGYWATERWNIGV
ncbi:BA75_01507T0 [Komagataella pastoris]|uniref:BA75_01507T0 n=1 Tax=Komagataella pastoris TaxID=4922 RepID=A0A1B2J9F3_PICPA|nr:BA75_01507T0 [Komagataella pastoris]